MTRFSLDPSHLADWSLSAVLNFSLILLAGLLVGVGSAPRANAQEARVGLRAGPTFGFLSDSAVPFSGGTRTTNANPRIDLHVGAYVVVPLTDHFALQPELLFLQKGGHFSQPLSERYAVERYRLAYLQGAFLLRRNLVVPGPLSVHLVAGLTVDRALGGVVQRNAQFRGLDFGDRIPLLETGRLQRWGVGGLVGGGVGYPLGTAGRVSLDVRYNPGFRTVFSNGDRSGTDSISEPGTVFPLPPPGLRHDVITASLSFTLPLAALF
ncbi:MAG: porin family protein [Salinibacter sp.]